LREKWEGRGATHDEQMNGRGKQERMLSKKKAGTYKKMKTDNVWGKKHSATDCSTKQNRMAFYLLTPPRRIIFASQHKATLKPYTSPIGN
jgi:hypothetical protein